MSSTIASSISRPEVLSLYRQIIKNSRKFTNYNFREYFLRRSRLEFKKNINLNDPSQISDLVNNAQNELAVLKRQAIISQLYTFDKTVIEPLKK